jgi:hypothetical protein
MRLSSIASYSDMLSHGCAKAAKGRRGCTQGLAGTAAGRKQGAEC